MKRLAKPKKIKKSTLKKKAWDAFSKYIRARDCIKTTGTLEKGRCITCNKVFLFKELQAGHFISGRHNELLFEEKNCYAQCFRCNVLLHGNLIPYTRIMQEMWGDEFISELEARNKITKQYKQYELVAIAEAYNDLYKQLIEL